MSLEGQPNTILTVYSPFAWVEDTTGSFVNFPTVQDALIKFPGTIGCSEIVGYNSTLINIPSDLAIGTEFTLLADEIEANAGSSINIVTLNDKAVNIGTSTIRTSNINIGSNPSAIVGETTGNVNIMCGTGRQEGSFNVLTNSANRGVINLGSTGSNEGGINIYAELKVGLKLGYSATLYATNDTHLGSYKRENYNNPVAMTINNAEKVIIGSISSLVNLGVYQLNFTAKMTFTNLNPQLSLGVYTRSTPAWVNGGLLGTGTLDPYLSTNNHYYTTAVANVVTVSLSGILVLTSKLRVACVLGNTNNNTMSISTTDTYLTLTRVG